MRGTHFFFFFQAEDGIRDYKVTGVQMCALPITMWRPSDDAEQNRIGARLGAEARAVAWPQQQRYAYHSFGGEGPTDLLPWLRFYAQRDPIGVDGPDSIPRGAILLQMVDGHLRVTPGTGAAAGGS